jgi:hypothetical protein
VFRLSQDKQVNRHPDPDDREEKGEYHGIP